MAYIPEESRPWPETRPLVRAWRRGLRYITLPARLAAILLLLVWVGPVTFAQSDAWELLRCVGAPGRAAGDSRVIPAGMAMQIAAGTPLKLHLRDGSLVEGRFLGRALLDSALYASRFAAHALASASAPVALDETLHVSLRDGREWSAPFAGYAELSLLLRSPDASAHRRVPFESAREIRRANGDSIAPADLAREFRDGSLPSAEALLLSPPGPMVAGPSGWHWPEPHKVAVEDIEWVSVDLPPLGTPARSGANGQDVAGIVVLSVLVSVVVVILLLKWQFDEANRSCARAPLLRPGALEGLSMTTRPFDRDRGCFQGDPLAVADPWPAATEGSTDALGNPESSAGLAAP